MRTTLLVLGVVVGLVALIAVVGNFLPKGHVARRSMVLKQPPDSVWNAMTDFPAQPSWRGDVKRVEKVSDGADGAVWREEGSNTLSLRTTESQPPTRLVRTIADTDIPFGGRWVYELAGQDGGTKVTITEEGEVYNPIFRFISHFFMNQAGTIEGYLTALAKRFGETASIQP